jgi:molecular chaperone Hsp33
LSHRDSITKFIFEQRPVRGEVVHLDASWAAALERVAYPPAVRELLGQAFAATALLASTLKFDGALTLQITGQGPVHLLVVQCDSERHLRGLARWSGEVEGLGFDALCGKEVGSGRMVITVEQRSAEGVGERYQGIVELEGTTLAAALEGYFARSEQLPTRLWLAADGERAAGFMLQVIPASAPDPDSWQHATVLADTLTTEELRALEPRQLLHRLYHEDDLRLLETAPVAFRCSCSRERIVEMLRALGADEVKSILAEHGKVEVSCEFCGREYRFDAVDVDQLLHALPAQPAPRGLH